MRAREFLKALQVSFHLKWKAAQSQACLHFFSVIGLSPMADDSQMSKNFTQPRDGKFCIQIEAFLTKLNFYYELLNFDENQVVASGSSDKYVKNYRFEKRVEIEHLPTGQYQLTLRNIDNNIYQIKPCSGMSMKRLLQFFLIWSIFLLLSI